MVHKLVRCGLAASFVACLCAPAAATLNPVGIWNGKVGLSIDAVGSNGSPVGNLQANIPTGSTILSAFLYSVGTPFPWYANSPNSLADYNGSGITLAGNSITNFDTLVGATSTRTDIGQWFTGRADVTSLIQSLATGGPNYSWAVEEGSLNTRIDGEVLAVVYQNDALAEGSVVLLDGGQDTGGETTTVNFDAPLGDVTDPNFIADMSLGISFSIGSAQTSIIDINGNRLSSSAGGNDDGSSGDGGLITAGGIGDTNDNPANPNSNFSPDDELYNLKPFLAASDTSFSIYTENGSNDDNIFMMGLRTSVRIGRVNDTPADDDEPPPTRVPDSGSTFAFLGLCLTALAFARRHRR